MQTSFTSKFLNSSDGQRVNEILRSCVHCGFCNATCPTYQLTGDELDGPRGRIYLIKDFFEEKNCSTLSMQHLDRCLTCLACETSCPSGVQYGDLIDIGRKYIEKNIQRPYLDRLQRHLIVQIFSNPRLVSILFQLARVCRPVLPNNINRKVPTKVSYPKPTKPAQTQRKMLSIKGCVQSTAAPQINAAATRALLKTGILLDESDSNCCGALAFHLTNLDAAKKVIQTNIDEWHRKLSDNYDNLLITSSGCSSFIKQYITIMQDDKNYADKAKLVSERCFDLSEITTEIHTEEAALKNINVAFHSPCTLQHGQQIRGCVENKLRKAGYTLVEVQDPHLCCGSAGSYSLLESKLSSELLENKLAHLQVNAPDIIATANIGCLMHLQSGTKLPVKHWIELLA